MDATPVTFTIEFNQATEVNVTKENVAKTGSVVLTKEDSVSKATLSGAEFELQNAAGTSVQANLTTNADGKLEVSDLAPGNYKFVETKAPTGYELDATPVTFTIEFNQAITSLLKQKRQQAMSWTQHRLPLPSNLTKQLR
nr:SpaA isopeptide-forming pilin-related protein [Listeria monocytogenes]